MAKTNFQQKFVLFRTFANYVLVGAIALVIGLGFFDLVSFWWLALVLPLITGLNCIWFVPTGYVGYKQVLSTLCKKTYTERRLPHFKLPFVTDIYLMNMRAISEKFTDEKKVISRNKVTLTATITYQIDEKCAHDLFRVLGFNYYQDHIIKWLDAAFDTLVSKLSYANFQSEKDIVEDWMTKMVTAKIIKECAAKTATLPNAKPFISKDYKLVQKTVLGPNPDPVDAVSNPTVLLPKMRPLYTGADKLEMVNDYDFSETPITLTGLQFFKSITLMINEVKFEDTYEKEKANYAVERVKTQSAEEHKKQKITEAEGDKQAAILNAEAKAKETQLTGDAENKVLKERGEILARNKDLLTETLAKNFPKVYGGGSTTMINLEELLKEVTSPATPTP